MDRAEIIQCKACKKEQALLPTRSLNQVRVLVQKRIEHRKKISKQVQAVQMYSQASIASI